MSTNQTLIVYLGIGCAVLLHLATNEQENADGNAGDNSNGDGSMPISVSDAAGRHHDEAVARLKEYCRSPFKGFGSRFKVNADDKARIPPEWMALIENNDNFLSSERIADLTDARNLPMVLKPIDPEKCTDLKEIADGIGMRNFYLQLAVMKLAMNQTFIAKLYNQNIEQVPCRFIYNLSRQTSSHER